MSRKDSETWGTPIQILGLLVLILREDFWVYV